MFDWFWEFLYSISKALMKVCDWLMDCAMVLLGIDPIYIRGQETDLLTYLLSSEQVKKMFGVCVLLAFVVLIMFTVFAILKNIAKEQPGLSPAQVGTKAFKSFLTFILVPTIMMALVFALNTFMKALYEATMGGNATIGAFLFTSFVDTEATGGDMSHLAPFLKEGGLDYYKMSDVTSVVDLSDYNYILCWIVTFVVIKNLGESIVSFIERAISIMILYVAAPFTIATSVLDDGAKFKTWREQVLIKFLSCYGTLLAINFYIMFCGLITNSEMSFFAEGHATLNKVAKILVILGGSLTMKKASALVANLLAQGGGADLNDPAGDAGRAFAGKAFKAAMKYNPIGAAAGFVGGALKDAAGRKLDNVKQKLGNSMLNKMGIDTGYDTNRLNGTFGSGAPSGAENNNQPKYNNDKENQLKEALENGNNEQNPDNSNNNKLQNNDILNNSVMNNQNNNKKEEQ